MSPKAAGIRAADVPVVWVQHSSADLPIDSEKGRLVTELQRKDAEPLVPKTYGDAFEDTNLYWQYHRAPGRTAGIVSTAAVDFD